MERSGGASLLLAGQTGATRRGVLQRLCRQSERGQPAVVSPWNGECDKQRDQLSHRDRGQCADRVDQRCHPARPARERRRWIECDPGRERRYDHHYVHFENIYASDELLFQSPCQQSFCDPAGAGHDHVGLERAGYERER